MSDRHTSKPAPRPKQGVRDIFRAAGADALVAVDHAEPVSRTARLQFIGTLILGVCIVFLASLLGVQHLDTALQVAVSAFVVGIVTLGLDFVFISMRFRPGLSTLLEWYTEGLQVAALTVGDGIGGIAVLVGVLAVVWHLSILAFWIGLITFVVGFLAFVAVALVYAIMRAVHAYKEQQAKAGGPPRLASTAASPLDPDSPAPPAAE
jgi:hypothetical protein